MFERVVDGNPLISGSEGNTRLKNMALDIYIWFCNKNRLCYRNLVTGKLLASVDVVIFLKWTAIYEAPEQRTYYILEYIWSKWRFILGIIIIIVFFNNISNIIILIIIIIILITKIILWSSWPSSLSLLPLPFTLVSIWINNHCKKTYPSIYSGVGRVMLHCLASPPVFPNALTDSYKNDCVYVPVVFWSILLMSTMWLRLAQYHGILFFDWNETTWLLTHQPLSGIGVVSVIAVMPYIYVTLYGSYDTDVNIGSGNGLVPWQCAQRGDCWWPGTNSAPRHLQPSRWRTSVPTSWLSKFNQINLSLVDDIFK